MILSREKIKGNCANLMTLCVPVSNKECNISIGCCERYRNNFSVVNIDSPISTSSSLETKGREVKETAYLVFDLKLVRPIPTSRNWTVCPTYTILPRIFSLLNAIPALLQLLFHYHHYSALRFRNVPCEKKWFIEIIFDIDNNIPICGDV